MTIALQDDGTTCTLFDAILEKHPSLIGLLDCESTILDNAAIKSRTVKILNNEETKFFVFEKSAQHNLQKKDFWDEDAAQPTTLNSSNFAFSIPKKHE